MGLDRYDQYSMTILLRMEILYIGKEALLRQPPTSFSEVNVISQRCAALFVDAHVCKADY